MKKLLLLSVMAVFALAAYANIDFQHLDNKGRNTTIVFSLSEDERDTTNGLSIDDVVFECNGIKYTASKVTADFGPTTTVTAKFPKLKRFSNARLSFTVNGVEKTIDIQKQLTQN